MFGIELLTPYRDPRVVDFAARLPAHYQYRSGQSKFLTREAMRALLPETVRTRPKSGSLAPFFRKGVLHQSASEVARLLDARDARWPQYVAPEALQRARKNPLTESDLLLIWLCISYELWWRAHSGSGPAVLASCVNRGGMSEALRD
jgi:asparagine synthase (glutamine-hydrolysing)